MVFDIVCQWKLGGKTNLTDGDERGWGWGREMVALFFIILAVTDLSITPPPNLLRLPYS